MRTWTADHPRVRSPKGVMSCDEIRFWIRTLREMGWSARLLARVVGICDRGGLLSKLRRSWIYPGEQVRFSRQLDRIISGELVQVKVGQRWEAVLADTPVPIRMPTRLTYDLTSGRLRWVKPRASCAPMLPSFQTAISRALL